MDLQSLTEIGLFPNRGAPWCTPKNFNFNEDKSKKQGMEWEFQGSARSYQVFPDVALRLSFNLGRQPSQEKGAQAPWTWRSAFWDFYLRKVGGSQTETRGLYAICVCQNNPRPSHFIGIFSLGPSILFYFFRSSTPPPGKRRGSK